MNAETGEEDDGYARLWYAARVSVLAFRPQNGEEGECKPARVPAGWTGTEHEVPIRFMPQPS